MPTSDYPNPDDPTDSQRIPNDLKPDEEIDGIGMRVKRRGRTFGLTFVGIVLILGAWVFYIAVAEKPRPPVEPLSASVASTLSRLPAGTNVLLYVGMTDVRASGFWRDVVPDSIKAFNFASDTSALARFEREAGFNFTRDTDTAYYAIIDQDKFLSVIFGRLETARVREHLENTADTSVSVNGGYNLFRVSPTLWACVTSSGNELVMGSSANLIESYLHPKSDFLKTDTLLVPLLAKTRFKSHLWLNVASPAWAMGALRGLTTTNKDLNESGSISKVAQMSISVQLTDGVKAQTEWIYRKIPNAFFSAGLIRFTIWVAKNFSSRVGTSEKALLNSIDVMSDRQSIVITADVSKDVLQAIRNKREK
jgi:hypothetical protein